MLLKNSFSFIRSGGDNIKKNGFTMIEILVALAILGILIIPIGSMVSSIINVNRSAQDNIKTAELMNDMVEHAQMIGLDNKKLDDYAKSLEENYPNYKFNYEEIKSESSNINGIDNNKSDVSLSIKDGKLNVQDNNNHINFKNINLDENILNKIKITASYKGTNTLKYVISNETSKDECSVETENPYLAIDFDDMNTVSKLDICIDGIYDANNTLISNKFIIFRYKRENTNINTISQTPFIIISKMEGDNSSPQDESVIKTNITIKNNNGKIIREQVYYFTKRLK